MDLGQASAVDRLGNALPVSLMNNATLFPPGKNEAIWQANRFGRKHDSCDPICLCYAFNFPLIKTKLR